MQYLKGLLSLLTSAVKDNLTLFLTFIVLGYMTFHPRQYHSFANTGETIWRGLVDWTAAATGWDSWVMTGLAWADMGLKGGYQVRIMIVSTVLGLALSILGRLVAYIYKSLFR